MVSERLRGPGELYQVSRLVITQMFTEMHSILELEEFLGTLSFFQHEPSF